MNEDWQAAACDGWIAETEGASTAVGPINEAAIAAEGSEVLRQEQR